MNIEIGDQIRPESGRADSNLRWAKVGNKRVFILAQKGAYPDICYDHGCLLASQIETGVFPEILDTIDTSTDFSSDVLSWITAAIYRRMSDDVFKASPDEFQDGAQALGDGIFDTIDDPRFSETDVRDAVVAIDVGNCAEGLARRLEKPLAEESTPTIGYVLGAARRYRRQSSGVGLFSRIFGDREAVGRVTQRFQSLSNRVGFGCTAFGLAPDQAQDGRGLHARTFDGAFFAWNQWPGIFIIDERETNSDWHRYVAIGTAGLTYSGGISGMNDAGIAASIHQMSTARYDTGRPRRDYAIAPFLQQRILREAGSIDQAHTILSQAKHHGSWTIVVSDAKTGQAARFELNGGTQTCARTDLGPTFSQSNHFLADETLEEHEFFDDLHYTPTFGKWLETRARISTVEDALAGSAAAAPTDMAIGLLSSHADGALFGAARSFGRTICKAYGLMASIARPDPDRGRADDQIWFSIGNAAPGPHADFVGFQIDWDALTVTPVDERPVRRPRLSSPEFTRASADYVQAFSIMSRPRDANGGYLGRDPNPKEHRHLLDLALQHLDRACQLAEDAGETDFAFRYARARIRHEAGLLDDAAEDWDFLTSIADAPGFAVHDYERALVLILSAATAFARGELATANDHLNLGAAKLAEVRTNHFPAGTRAHPHLDKWAGVIADLRKSGADADLPYFDWVTVE